MPSTFETIGDLSRAWCLIVGGKIVAVAMADNSLDAVERLTVAHVHSDGSRVACADSIDPGKITARERMLIIEVVDSDTPSVLRSLRTDLGLSSGGFAKYLTAKGVKVTASALRQYENGTRLPRPDIAADIEDALQLKTPLRSRLEGRPLKTTRFLVDVAALRRAGIEHPIASREPSGAPVLVELLNGSRWSLSIWSRSQWRRVDSRQHVRYRDIKRLMSESTR